MNLTTSAGGNIRGNLTVPGDKSISHRAIMLGSLAEGVSVISGFLQGEDSLATLAAFQTMGVDIALDNEVVTIKGVGMYGLRRPISPLDVGNSGTAMRLMAGLLAGQNFDSVLSGDASLNTRPMRRIMTPLQTMGADISGQSDSTAPLKINPHQLTGIDYAMPVASAQVKSSILLAGLYANGTTCISEPAPTRDHTERMLHGFGYQLTRTNNQVCLNGGGKLHACDIQVPADISSAAFFIVGASIADNSAITLTGVGINPTRTGIIDIMRLMGADINLENPRDIAGEPVADITVKSARLVGINIPEHLVALAIDEFPAILVAAACAQGQTVLSGAAELRVKESDRVAAMAEGLQRLGVDATATDDGMVVNGQDNLGDSADKPIEINSFGDHRIAMAFAMASLRSRGPLKILDCANINTSFPDFIKLSNRVGLGLGSYA